ncbi:MAG TPA: alpha/beta fold hydrolase [Solirubrobacteraceae bacterium]
MARRRRRPRRGRRAAVRVRQHGDARPALGDRRSGGRDPARGGPHRDARRAPPVGLVRPVAQRRGRPAQPWLRRQPGRIPAHVRMLARHGYGVLALDNPGNGESEGHSNGLGDNAQPAIAAGLDYLEGRPDVDPKRIAGFGLSLGGEVLLEAAGHDRRLAAVVSDGAARPVDGDKAKPKGGLEGALGWLTMRSVRAVAGMKTSPSLLGMMPRIAPRPVLLVAGGGFPDEIPASRLYRDAGDASVQLWELPDTGHTAGLRKHPAAYERRTVGFLDRALGVR